MKMNSFQALANDLQNLQVTLRAMNDGQLQLYEDAVLSVFEQERQSRLHAMQSQGQIQQGWKFFSFYIHFPYHYNSNYTCHF